MNSDLEDTLRELGPAYRVVVGRLLSAAEPAPETRRLGAWRGSRTWWRVAAALAVTLSGWAVHEAWRGEARTGEVTRVSEYELAYIRDASAVREMIRTQQPDGGWKNDFLTRQNAAALKVCTGPAAQIAYKKAVRNLRRRGLL